MDMAPLALSAHVESLTLADHESLSSAFLSSSASSATNTTGIPMATTAPVGFDGTQSFQAALGLKVVASEVAKTTKTEKASPEKKVFRCSFPGCGREFQLKGNLKRHANIHNGDKKFACKFCGKRFLRKADMEVHYRVHTGEKPYRCKYQECGKCFARRSDLLSHERTHTGRKPFACAFPGCDRSFARKFDLHKHQRLHEDQADGSGKAKCKKRKLSPRQAVASTPATPKGVDSGDESCDCPSDVATPFVGGATSTEAALNADVLLPEHVPATTTFPPCPVGRRKLSTAACVDTPTRPMRYELKCPENHIHSPPACLAALSSWDAFLLSQETLDLARPFSLDAFPPHCPSTTIGTSCCPAHLELRPPPPDDHNTTSTEAKVANGPDILDQLLFAPMTMANNPKEESPSSSNTATASGLQSSTLPGSVIGPMNHRAFPEASLAFIGQENTVTRSVQDTANAAPAQAKSTPEKVCLSTPTPVESLLDYSRHNRSCGHLSIQHGNHRDYVVQNHLVCQDSITRLGSVKRGPGNAKAEEVKAVVSAKPVECTSPKDTHRPGCGHLPVRHKDHIDYVVEDNLICQQASWLEDDNLELLGDDFWDFYGAIDAFPTT